MSDCIFCKIAAGEIPCHKVWENDEFLAFLDIFPTTEALTLVIPKVHHQSDVFELAGGVRNGLMDAATVVSKRIQAVYPDVGRVGLVFEGFGVNHVHAKLYPFHGTALPEWKPITHDDSKYFDQYEGYISTHEGKREDDGKLAEIAKKIRNKSEL